MADPMDIDSFFEQNRPGSGSTPAPSGTPTVSGTPKPKDRTDRQNYISSMSEAQQWAAVRAGVISEQELIEVEGLGRARQILDTNNRSKATLDLVEQWKTTPPNIPALPPQPYTPQPGLSPEWQSFNEWDFQHNAGLPISPSTSAVGPDGRTFAQVTGTPYRSEAERAWYLQQASAGAGRSSAGGSSSSPRASTSGSSGQSSAPATPAAPQPEAAPPPPAINSRENLESRGALPVNGAQVLDGTQYRQQNVTIKGPDNQWYVVNPEGNILGGPFPTQALANTQSALTPTGPAVTGNQFSYLPQAALQGVNRPRVTGSGQQAPISIDQIIQSSDQKGYQPGDFVGSAQPWQTGLNLPVDIIRGGIPDYGGMTEIADAYGTPQSYSGRINTVSGPIAIGVGAGNAQSLRDSGLPDSIISALSPAQQAQAQQAIDAMRQAGTMPDLGALRNLPTASSRSSAAPKEYTAALAQVRQAIGLDPYDHDYAPATFDNGGQINMDPAWNQFKEWDMFNRVVPLFNHDAVLDPSQVDDQRGASRPWWQLYRPWNVASSIFNSVSRNPLGGEILPDYAKGGSMTISEPSTIKGLISGKDYGVMGAAPEKVTITPLGTPQQQRAAGVIERGLARSSLTGQPRQTPWMGDVRPILQDNTQDGPLPGSTLMGGRYIANHDAQGNFTGWSPADQFRPWKDENRNGINDWDEINLKLKRNPKEVKTDSFGDRAYSSQATPNIFAGGGTIMTNPDILRMVAAGVTKRPRPMIPQGLI